MHEHIHITEGLHVEEAALKPEDARWLALLFDTEGAIGYTKYTAKADRLDERYRYEYPYYTPYYAVGMDILESEPIIRKAATLTQTATYTHAIIIRIFNHGGKAIKYIREMEPHLVKFKRMATLLLTIFKTRYNIPAKEFETQITTLFGKFLTAEELNPILLKMTPQQYQTLINKIILLKSFS